MPSFTRNVAEPIRFETCVRVLLKLFVIAIGLAMEDVHVKRAIQSACERMSYSTLKDEQFRIIADVLSGRDILVCLPTGGLCESLCLRHSLLFLKPGLKD